VRIVLGQQVDKIYNDTKEAYDIVQNTVETTSIVKATHTSTIETAVKRTNPFSVWQGRASSSLCREENGPPLEQNEAQNKKTKPPCWEENKLTIEQRTAQSKQVDSQQCGKSRLPICGHLLSPTIHTLKHTTNMSDPAPAKTVVAKAKKSAKKTDHPSTAAMVVAAITALKDRKGSSLAAIKKYIGANYKVNVAKLAPFVRRFLKKAVADGNLAQSGSLYLYLNGQCREHLNETTKPSCLVENKTQMEQITTQCKPTASQPCDKNGVPICGKCLKVGHLNRQCREPQRFYKNGETICAKCFKVKPIKELCCIKCLNRHAKKIAKNTNICGKCSKVGHARKQCRENNAGQRRERNAKQKQRRERKAKQHLHDKINKKIIRKNKLRLDTKGKPIC